MWPYVVRRLSSLGLFTFATSPSKSIDWFWFYLVGMTYSRTLTSVVVWPYPPRGGFREGQNNYVKWGILVEKPSFEEWNFKAASRIFITDLKAFEKFCHLWFHSEIFETLCLTFRQTIYDYLMYNSTHFYMMKWSGIFRIH